MIIYQVLLITNHQILKNIIYVVKKTDSDFGQSWQDWINAVSLGADFYDGNKDGIYNPTDLNGNNIWDSSEDKPALIGDEMTWCIYNDKVPAGQRRFTTVTSKGIEIQQTVAAYASIPNTAWQLQFLSVID